MEPAYTDLCLSTTSMIKTSSPSSGAVSIVNCWDDYFSPKFTFPFHVSVGSGAEFRRIQFTNDQQYLNFLRSRESLHAWSESDVDLISIASFTNKPVWIFNFRQEFSR